jgi:hypothetical protein
MPRQKNMKEGARFVSRMGRRKIYVDVENSDKKAMYYNSIPMNPSIMLLDYASRLCSSIMPLDYAPREHNRMTRIGCRLG